MSRVVVVGAGLSGLSAACRLLDRRSDLELTVLEAAARPGGILGTVERDGFVIETGPDSILAEKTAAIELAERLGIAERLVRTLPEHRGAYVVHRGRLVRVPEGFSLMAPARWRPWARTPIVSWRGKLRAALEPFVPASGGERDESLARFVRRRFGREVLERLAQPLVGGIYGSEPERLSLSATMPRFVQMEREAGSVIRAMRGRRRRATEAAASGARYGLFVAFDRGMQVLVDALAERVGPRLALQRRVVGLERGAAGWALDVEGPGGQRRRLSAERVVLALPAWRAAGLLQAHHRALSDALLSIPYGSAATVTFAWPRSQVPHPLDAYGFVVPAVERRSVLAATFSSVKWPGRAPEGQVLLRVFIGGANAPDAVDLADEDAIALCRRELSRLLGIEGAPSLSMVCRYRRAMPQYQLGHLARVGRIEAMQRELPGLTLAGNAYRGVGIPDAIAYAQAAADALLAEGQPAAAGPGRPDAIGLP